MDACVCVYCVPAGSVLNVHQLHGGRRGTVQNSAHGNHSLYSQQCYHFVLAVCLSVCHPLHYILTAAVSLLFKILAECVTYYVCVF